MKVHDITIGTKGRMRKFSDIHETTRAYFRQHVPALPVQEVFLPDTPFHLTAKRLDVGAVTELYHAEQMCFVTYCCTDPDEGAAIMKGVATLAGKMGFPPPVEPATDLFLYTFPVNPFLPSQHAMLAGEIGFYIFFRVWELVKKK